MFLKYFIDIWENNNCSKYSFNVLGLLRRGVVIAHLRPKKMFLLECIC